MKTINRKSLASAGFAMCLASLTAAPSHASTVTLDYVGTVNDSNVTAQISGVEVDPRGFPAGSLSFQEVNSAETFIAWCMEVAVIIANRATYNTSATLLSAERESLISRLFTGFIGETTNDIGAAAFQLAIWEIVEETTVGGVGALDVTSGTFTAAASNGTVIDTANQFLASLGNFEAKYKINYFQSANSQDLITVAPIPLPASFLLLGAGIGAMVAFRRRSQPLKVEA